jgi:hypothetical protein
MKEKRTVIGTPNICPKSCDFRELGNVETKHHHHYCHHLYDNFMKPTFLEKLTVYSQSRNSPNFMEPESSLQLLRQPAACTYSETVHKWFCNCLRHFLGAFVKLQKATISFVISVYPSVRKEQLGCHWTDFQ